MREKNEHCIVYELNIFWCQSGMSPPDLGDHSRSRVFKIFLPGEGMKQLERAPILVKAPELEVGLMCFSDMFQKSRVCQGMEALHQLGGANHLWQSGVGTWYNLKQSDYIEVEKQAF
jgi:hypothetical protein